MSMTIKDIISLGGEVRYSCPSCQTLNYIKLENFENYLDIYDVHIPYNDMDHTHRVEFISPKCEKCGETFVTFIKRGD